MVVYNEQKPRTIIGAESEFDRAENGIPRPEVRITQSNAGSSSAIALVIVAIVLAAGAYLLYTNNWSATTVAPPVTQNNITLTAPAAKAPDPADQPAPAVITPVPATPPAAEKTAPVTPDPAKPAQ